MSINYDQVTIKKWSNTIHQQIDLSIIIPMYNVENYIIETLNSMKGVQNYTIELLLIDDGSTDATLELTQQWLSQNNIDYTLISNKNEGPSKSRNLGIAEARGKLITFFDSDDVAFSYVYEDIINIMNNYNIDFTIVRGVSFNQVTQDIYEFPDFYVWNKIIGDTDLKILTPSQEPRIARLEPSAVMRVFKKDFLISNNITFPEGYFFEDLSFHVECIQKSKKIALFNKTLLMYRVNREGQTTSSFGKKRNDILHILPLVVDLYKKKLVTDDVWSNFVGLLVRMTIWCAENCSYEDKPKFIDESSKILQKLPKDLFNTYINHYSYDEWERNICKAYLNQDAKTLYWAAEGGYPNNHQQQETPHQYEAPHQDIDIRAVYNKVEELISQQRDGWAHDRFNVLNGKIEALLSQNPARNLLYRIKRKVKHLLLQS